MTYGSDGALSASDVALLTGNNGRTGDGMFGDTGAWFIVLFLIFAIFGWGGNRGFGNGGGVGATDNYTLASDFATIQRQLSDGFSDLTSQSRYIQNGLCDGFYAMNTGMLNGFAGVQNAMCQGFSGVNNSIMTNGYETRNAINGVSSQLAGCCCDIRQQIADASCGAQRSIDGVNYNMAANTNAIQQSLCNSTRDLLESNNNNTRAILDFLTQDKISTLTAENQALKFQASQTAQNAFISANQEAQTAELIRRLGADCPVNAYVVQPPTPVTFPTSCCGQFSGYNNCNGCY